MKGGRDHRGTKPQSSRHDRVAEVDHRGPAKIEPRVVGVGYGHRVVGAGNSVFPLLSSNQNPELRLYAYDYSTHAVKLVQVSRTILQIQWLPLMSSLQRDPLYLGPPFGTISASVWDVTSPDGIPSNLEPSSVDIVILVFVLSALHPDEWGRAICNIHQVSFFDTFYDLLVSLPCPRCSSRAV